MRKSYEIGFEAESKAVDWFLKNRPSRLLCRNFRCKMGEIDFIVEETKNEKIELVFIEVRSRSRKQSWIRPLESISPTKKRCLKKTADYFLARYQGEAKSIRFDLLCWDLETWEHRMNIQIGD